MKCLLNRNAGKAEDFFNIYSIKSSVICASRVYLVSFYEYIQRYSYDSFYKPQDPVSTKVRTV